MALTLRQLVCYDSKGKSKIVVYITQKELKLGA